VRKIKPSFTKTQTSMKKLSPVIRVNESRCVNCNVCIRVCPVRYCNNGSSGQGIDINPDLCIGCGFCIRSCPHGAREIIDDTDRFMTDLRHGVKMIAIVAPAIAANFPERYFQFNTWLRSIGIRAVFDVSFGAELTVKSYLEYIKAKNPELVIAQPCPAIVTYIQIYRPELIPYLAPAQSPMLHTILMIREFYKQYDDHKIAVISPCIAKKREFEETKLGDYNVTMAKLDDYLTKHKINLDRFEPTDYDNPTAERAVLLSTPGGLMRTTMREVVGIEENIRKIEGPSIYHYLDHLDESRKNKTNPLMIDCLNCELGCNGGTGTKYLQDVSQDKLESLVEKRSNSLRELYQEEQKNILPKMLTNFFINKLILIGNRPFMTDVTKTLKKTIPSNFQPRNNEIRFILRIFSKKMKKIFSIAERAAIIPATKWQPRCTTDYRGQNCVSINKIMNY
jgi:iron only hydrogenase large subunit-like protein